MDFFEYKGYRIPIELVNLTGGGPETWEAIARHHMDAYAKFAPIDPGASILEPGCGVGRDAIELTEHLSRNGSYIGFDIIRPSIDWCRQNITPRHPNFRFHWMDIFSQIHNPSGTLKVQDVILPAEDGSVDRILLQSVFTHMFREDIVHYLREFRRVLKPNGLAFASCFILDDTARAAIERTRPALTFEHRYDDYWINNADFPEGSVAYTEPMIVQMLERSGMKLAQPMHYGAWSGRENPEYGQDLMVVQPA